jgi:hypothetical protein
MREFGRAAFSIGDAPRPLRLIYGAFLVLIGPGFLTQMGVQIGRIGVTPHAIAVYYRGSEAGDVMAFPKTFGQLLEVTHAHAFVMGIVFLILAHLFIATSASNRFKAIVLAGTFVGTLGDLAAPWLVRYGAAGWAWLALAAWGLQATGNVLLIVVSGWDCVGRQSTTNDPRRQTRSEDV